MEMQRLSKTDLMDSRDLREALLSLNNEHAVELSWLDIPGLQALVAEAFFAGRIGNIDALMLALDQDAEYQSPNFLWFKARYDHFVYVDRIVVSEKARGRGLARRLYQELFDEAVRAGHSRVVCEVNAIPPNPTSDAFHKRLGFEPVGRGSIHKGSKRVTYLEKKLP